MQMLKMWLSNKLFLEQDTILPELRRSHDGRGRGDGDGEIGGAFLMNGTMNEKCDGCSHKNVHPILGGYFCIFMKRSFCGLEPDTFLDCGMEALNDGKGD